MIRSRSRSIRAAGLLTGLAGLVAASTAYGFGVFGTPPISTTTGSAHYWIEVLDYDGDSDGDLVVADYQDDEIEAYPGDGDGTFGAPQSIALPNGSEPDGIAVGEFVGDDRKDLAVTNYGNNTISILRGIPDGFDLKRTFASKSKQPYPVVAKDIDRDGKTDLVVGNENAQGSSVGVTTYLGKGNGRFESPKKYLGTYAVYGLALAKMNRGGKLDAVVVNARQGTVTVMLGRKRGKFSPWAIRPTAGSDLAYDALAMGDFNGDRKQDAVVAHVDRFVLLRGKGDGAFKAPRSFTAPGGGVDGIEAGDFNDDDDLDVALATPAGIRVALGNGNGRFGATTQFGGGLAVPVSLASGSLNGDAGIDLVRGAETGYDIYLNLDN